MDYLPQKYLPWDVPKDRTKPDQLSNIQIEIQRNIIQRLSVYTLGRLAMVSRFYYGLATPVQYKKDACDEPPRAILWAASCAATPDTKKIIKKVLDLAVAYGGNVNRICPLILSDKIATYTPLHLAAARGNKTAAKKLLKLGADPNALGWEFFRDTLFSPSVKALASIMPNKAIHHISLHCKWRPLFFPFLNEDKKMIKLLLHHRASPVLAVPIEDEMASPVDPGTINLLHILSALPKEKFTKDASLQLYFRIFPQLINIPIMAGLTPLFLSIHRGNDILLKEIMTNGGNIEDVNYIGRTPLMQAIVCCCMKEDPEVRICYKGIISNMIECFNAKVGNLGDADVMETPLICIIKELPTPLPTDWKHRIQDIKEIIDLLLKHGADINEVSNAGFTMLHVLCDIICKTQQTGSLLDLFGSLIEYGADLSIPSHRGQSVLGMCIIKYNRQPTKFYNFLQKLGASLVRQEIDAVFVEWAQCPGFRKSFDMIQYKNHITQPAIDSAYETAFFKDGKLFHLLKEHFPKTTIAEKVASEALLTLENYSKQFGFALEFDSFNGLYIHSNGNSLLHSIVDRLEKYPKYKDAHARDDAYNVLCKGAPLEHKDTQGKTPLQKLFCLRKERDCPILRLFLYDVRAGWEDLGEEPTQDKAQEIWLRKRKRVLDALM